MKNHVATAMAPALVAGVVGLSAVPFTGAVGGDCSDELEIPDQADSGSLIVTLESDELSYSIVSQ